MRRQGSALQPPQEPRREECRKCPRRRLIECGRDDRQATAVECAFSAESRLNGEEAHSSLINPLRQRNTKGVCRRRSIRRSPANLHRRRSNRSSTVPLSLQFSALATTRRCPGQTCKGLRPKGQDRRSRRGAVGPPYSDFSVEERATALGRVAGADGCLGALSPMVLDKRCG